MEFTLGVSKAFSNPFVTLKFSTSLLHPYYSWQNYPHVFMERKYVCNPTWKHTQKLHLLQRHLWCVSCSPLPLLLYLLRYDHFLTPKSIEIQSPLLSARKIQSSRGLFALQRPTKTCRWGSKEAFEPFPKGDQLPQPRKWYLKPGWYQRRKGASWNDRSRYSPTRMPRPSLLPKAIVLQRRCR